MARTNKVKLPSSRPASAAPEAELDGYRCSRCGRVFPKQKTNFTSSHSPLFRGSGYLPVCIPCMDELFKHYKEKLGSESEAMHRICLKFDVYWHPKIWGMVEAQSGTASRVRSYMAKTNLYKYIDKSYDDTLDEGIRSVVDSRTVRDELPPLDDRQADSDDEPVEDDATKPIEIVSDVVVDDDVVRFWGGGFRRDMYVELEERYSKWTDELPKPLDNATEALYKQVCVLEMTINRNTVAGKPIEQSVNALNTVLGSLNAKPIQKKQDEQLDVSFETMPFGMGIKVCENTRPIPKSLPEFDDVDGVVRTVTIYFLGHLCHMLHIRNTYCKMYEEEMSRLRVQYHIDEEEEDEDAFNDIFGSPNTDGGDGD